MTLYAFERLSRTILADYRAEADTARLLNTLRRSRPRATAKTTLRAALSAVTTRGGRSGTGACCA